MVFIKLQFKDNIKKILIAKEEISWQKICEILHQIFKLGDSNSIHLVYQDEEESKTIEIKSNSELLEMINKKLLKQFIKFFVFYSGAVEADIAYTSLSDVNSSTTQALDVSRKGKKKKIKKETNDNIPIQNNDISLIEFQQSEKSSNGQDQEDIKIPKIVEDISADTSPSQKLNSLIELESGEHLKNILSKAINKSQVFEEIKGKIRQFISESKSSDDGSTTAEKADIIEYQVQTNLQHLSDLFVQNIRDVLDDEMLKQLNSSDPSRKQRIQDQLDVDKNKQFQRKDSEQGTLKLSPARNTITSKHSYPSTPTYYKTTTEDTVLCDQEESVYETDIQTKKSKKTSANHDKMLELIQEQNDQSILNIENALLQSQRVSEAHICQTFDQSYKSIRHLFDSMTQKQHKKPVSALQLRLLLDKQVQQYSLLDSYSDETPTQQVSKPQVENQNSFDDTIVQVIAPLHSFENEKIVTQKNQYLPGISAGLIPDEFQAPLNNNIEEDLEQIQNMPALIMTKKISHQFVQNS